MGSWTALARRNHTPRTPAIIIAVDQADAQAYADKHNCRPYIALTPRNPYAARGRIAPVYATRKARRSDHYYPLLREARPAGATLERKPRDRRVA